MDGFFSSTEFKGASESVERILPKCGACGLFRKCQTPKMRPYGKGGNRVLVVGEAPGATEDEEGRPFIGKAGEYLRDTLHSLGFDLDRDALTTNSLICRPPKNVTPEPKQLEYCRPNLTQTIRSFEPTVIIPLGRSALSSVLAPFWKEVSVLDRWVGWRIPAAGYWICPTYHPSYLLRMNNPMLERIFSEHLEAALAIKEPPPPAVDYESRVQPLYDPAKIQKVIRQIMASGKVTAFDYETNCLKPEYPHSAIYSCAICAGEEAISFPWTEDIISIMREFLSSSVPKIAHNLKFEERWSKNKLGVRVNNWAWDGMLAAHCLDNRNGITSLKFQSFVQLGVPVYNAHIEPFLSTSGRNHLNRIHEIPMHDLLVYGGMDVLLERRLSFLQRALLKDRSGYELLHHGCIELADIEANGIGVDAERIASTKNDLEKKLSEMTDKLIRSSFWKRWKAKFGIRANMGSRDQLGEILYSEMKYEVTQTTETGKPATDEEALQKIDHPFVTLLLERSKVEKALKTYITGIGREVVGDRLHPVFNLHTVRTYRSSSDSPNFQNIPVRNKDVASLVRRIFVPRKGCVIVENDFKGIEVNVSACYHKDPNFISYITTPGKDMHRDMAAQIYMMEPKEVSKDVRYGAKNKFVFPQFYGDYYVSCARALWDWIGKGKLTGPGGIPMMDHLREQGIRKLGECNPDKDPVAGTFEAHLREVENDFWGRRFMAYGRWRKEWYKAYLSRGYFDLLTGFRIQGIFPRNAVVNYPVQGSAFHCLLWSAIQINREIRVCGMESKCVGQIHDSLIGEVKIEELRDYLQIVERVTTKDLRNHYQWIIVPMEIEYEITPSIGTWFDKREVKFKGGRFHHPDNSEKTTVDSVRFVRALDERFKNE